MGEAKLGVRVLDMLPFFPISWIQGTHVVQICSHLASMSRVEIPAPVTGHFPLQCTLSEVVEESNAFCFLAASSRVVGVPIFWKFCCDDSGQRWLDGASFT